MKKDAIQKHIRELGYQSQLAPGVFYNLVCDAINESESGSVEIPNMSTTNRWFRGETEPGKEMFPFIAKAFGVSEDEIALGRKPKWEIRQEEISQALSLEDDEKKKLLALINMEPYYFRLFASLLISAGVILLNRTLGQNGLVYFVAIVVIGIALAYDDRREKRINGKRIGIGEQTKLNVEFLRSLLKRNLVSRLVINVLLIVIFIIFLPSIELLFYRGKFFVSCTVYFITAVILLIKSVDR